LYGIVVVGVPVVFRVRTIHLWDHNSGDRNLVAGMTTAL